MAHTRPTPALTRPANVKNLEASIAKARAMQEAAKAASASAAEAKALALATPTPPHPGIPPMTTTAGAK